MKTPEILFLYHSGSGSTKAVSKQIKSRLEPFSRVVFQSVNRFSNFAQIPGFDLLVIAFPTYHCHPSKSTLEFIRKLPIQLAKQKTYILTTCGLFRGNSIRILARKLLKKNFVTVGHATIRGPASDGALMSPVDFKMMYRYQKDFASKIAEINNEMIDIVNENRQTVQIPFPSWYAPLNAPNKYLGMLTSNYLKNKMHILTDACINCKKCVAICERGCYAPGESQPVLNHDNCEFCLKCIHHCAQKAITFSRKMNRKKRLDARFYAQLIAHERG